MRQTIIIPGVIAGVLGALATLVMAESNLALYLGGFIGTLAAAALGVCAAWVSTRLAEQEVAEALTVVRAPAAGTPTPTGNRELDTLLGEIHQVVDQGERARVELEDLERIARNALDSAGGANGHASGLGTGLASSRANPVGSLRMLLIELGQVAGQVVRDARLLNDAAEGVVRGGADQSEAVGRTTSAVESVSDNIDQISQNAEAAAEASQRARQEARHGLEQVQGMIEGMERIRAHVETNGRKVRRLGDRSVEIGTIVDLISGISNRTDMLALNATIESVRAGEHGRGFAVVADEIRKLSERTAAATREIGALVEVIQADTHESIRAFNEEQSEVEREAELVREAGTALQRISEVSENSAVLVDGISRSANEQVLATQELVGAMQQFSELTQQSIEGAARACEHGMSLLRQCELLGRLSALESGRRGPSAAELVGAGVGPTGASTTPTPTPPPPKTQGQYLRKLAEKA